LERAGRLTKKARRKLWGPCDAQRNHYVKSTTTTTQCAQRDEAEAEAIARRALELGDELSAVLESIPNAADAADARRHLNPGLQALTALNMAKLAQAVDRVAQQLAGIRADALSADGPCGEIARAIRAGCESIGLTMSAPAFPSHSEPSAGAGAPVVEYGASFPRTANGKKPDPVNDAKGWRQS
jgi:hypothetical protein